MHGLDVQQVYCEPCPLCATAPVGGLSPSISMPRGGFSMAAMGQGSMDQSAAFLGQASSTAQQILPSFVLCSGISVIQNRLGASPLKFR